MNVTCQKPDHYLSIASPVKTVFTQQRSKFIAFATPVESVSAIKDELDSLRKQYYDARHICWAYMLGEDRLEYRCNDDGEPSGTAGKPILGQINSNNLTNILIAVVRYFGGIKLGTSGLIGAYKTAAAQAIAEAVTVEKAIERQITVEVQYIFLNEVIRIAKEMHAKQAAMTLEVNCSLTFSIARSKFEELLNRLEKVKTLRVTKC